MTSNWKAWVNPLTVFTFTAVAFTGVLMFFEVEAGPIKGIHEWMGVAFAIAGGTHLVLHWRVFWAKFKQRETILSLVGVALLCVLLLFASAGGPGEGPEHHGRHGRPPLEESGRN